MYFLIRFTEQAEKKDVQQVEAKQPEPTPKPRTEPETKKKSITLPREVETPLPETPLPETKKDKPASSDAPPKILRLDEAIELVKGLSDKFMKEFQDEFPGHARLLTPEQLDLVESIIRRKHNNSVHVQRDNFTERELKYLMDHKAEKWVVSKILEWACNDDTFLEIAKYIWNRSPKKRDANEIKQLAVSWAYRDFESRFLLFILFEVIERNARTLEDSERIFLIRFSGEEYYINRPSTPPSMPATPPTPPKEVIFTTPVVPKPSKPVVAAEVAPPLPIINIAPAPRQIFWTPSLSGYSSEWQKVGAIDVRIAGLSISKVPIIDAKERVVDSEFPMFVVIVEARKNTPGRKRTLRPFSTVGGQYGRIFDADSNELSPANIPLGKKLNSGLPRSQLLPDDGTAVRDVLLFTVPVDNVGNLELRLDADRCDETGDIWFKIPALAWKKK
jgi:hypothetical protein